MTANAFTPLGAALALVLTASLSGQTGIPAADPAIAALDTMAKLPGGLGALPAPPIPPGNPQTPAKIELGRKLFLDQRLSGRRLMSCATCHDPSKAYTDGRALAVGGSGFTLRRRTPSLLNAAYNRTQFWDGRAKTLEEQALIPLLADNEMGMPGRKALLTRVQKIPEYRSEFREAFGREINLPDMARALAAFERTLVTPDSAFDRYETGDKQALTDQQKRGLILFIGKAACSQCHNGPNFTDSKFHRLGFLPGQHANSDLGRFAITHDPADRYAFKTPSLRNASRQSHFMHDGSLASLEQVIEFYDDGGGRGPKSKLLFKLDLADAEKADLLVFLRTLAGTAPH